MNNFDKFGINNKKPKNDKIEEKNTFEDIMDISNLSSGSYIVKIHTPKGIADKKLIIP